jgi:hypothetical protein
VRYPAGETPRPDSRLSMVWMVVMEPWLRSRVRTAPLEWV